MSSYRSISRQSIRSNKSLNQYANLDDEPPSDNASEAEVGGEEEESQQVGGSAEEVYPTANSPKLWPKKLKRRNLLLYSLASFIVSIGQSIILPSIENIGKDLGGNQRTTAATLTVPLIVLGIMNMIFSPFSDVYGRKIFHLFGLLIFTGASIACGFSGDIYQLIGFRVAQAFGAAAPAIVGAGAVSDMFDIDQRGQALGLFLLGPLIGPVMGPIFGGLLASVNLEAVANWRMIFWIIGGCGGLLFLVSICGVKETLIHEGSPRTCPNPFAPLVFLKYFRITFLIIVLSIGFAGFFAINISFPKILTESYNQPALTIGLCYLPFGVGLVIGAVVGGRSADRIRRKGGTAEHRLIPSLLFIPLNGLGIVAQGWVFETKPSLAIVLVISFFLGFSFILPRPGTNTYAIEKLKVETGRDVASSATGLIFGVMLPFSAIIAQLSVLGVEALGYGLYLTIIGSAMVLSTIPVGIFVIRDIRKNNLKQAQSPPLLSKEPKNSESDVIN